MKKIVSIILTLCIILVAISFVTFSVNSAYVNDFFNYYVTLDDEACIVSVDDSISGNIVIPSTIDGYPVTSIENYAFSDCHSITHITIPDRMISIGEGVFSGCDSLTTITFSDSVTSIGACAFSGCYSLTNVNITDISAWCDINFEDVDANPLCWGSNLYLNGVVVNDLVIPDTVTIIKDNAFYRCDSLTSITIPDSVISIGDSAFESCTSLTTITIPDSVTSIGDCAFSFCDLLEKINVDHNNKNYLSLDGILFNKDVTELICYPARKIESNYNIPNSVTSVKNNAFAWCDSLTNITIPNNVKSIGYDAFMGCKSLTKVNIIDLSAWCNIEFENSLANPVYYAKSLYLNGEMIDDLVIPNTVSEIKLCAFYNCTSLTTITIPDSVTSIGASAFRVCANLTSINIPDSVTSIGFAAFYNCTSLTEIDITDSVANIGDYAFYNCSSLASINLPDIAISIGKEAFNNTAYYNNTAKWDNDVLYINNHLIEAKATLSGSYIINNSTRSIAEYAFYHCNSLIDITIPDGIMSIGERTFYWCDSLTSITIPNSVTSIGFEAFSFCTALSTINIPNNSVTSIGDFAFEGCYSLKYITIPNGVISIGEGTFRSCDSLTSITIPDSVISIGEEAFYCDSLENVYYRGNEEDKIKIVIAAYGNYSFTSATWYCNSCVGYAVHNYVMNGGKLCDVCGDGVARKGDLDLNDIINTSDMAIAKLFLAGVGDLSDTGKLSADLNGDDEVNTTDLASLKLELAGIE